MREQQKSSPEKRLGFCVDGLLAEQVHLGVGRHVVVPVAIALARIQALVERLHDGYAALRRAVVLRNEMIEDRAPESRLLRREMANRRRRGHPLLHQVACRRLPEFLLTHGAVAGIITGLRRRRKRLAGDGVARQKCGVNRFVHAFLRRSRLAIKPSMPAAPNNSGAKMGGP